MAAPIRSARRSARPASRAAAGPPPEVDQELPVALRPEDRRGDHVERLQARGLGRGDDALDRGSVDRRVPDDAAVDQRAAGLELWLHERNDIPAGRIEGGPRPVRGRAGGR